MATKVLNPLQTYLLNVTVQYRSGLHLRKYIFSDKLCKDFKTPTIAL